MEITWTIWRSRCAAGHEYSFHGVTMFFRRLFFFHKVWKKELAWAEYWIMLNFTHADFSRIKKCTCQGLCVFENKSFIHHCYAFNFFLTFSLFAMEIRWCDRAHLFLWISNNVKKILLFHFRNIKISLNMFTFKKNQPNFVSSNLKFHNQYCHNLQRSIFELEIPQQILP